MIEQEHKERYALLMCERKGAWQEQSPETSQALLERYFTWVDDLMSREIFKGGEGLQDEGVTIKVVDGQAVDGPFAETKEIVAGFFLVEVTDQQEAWTLASTCPALTHGRELLVTRWYSEPDTPSAMLEGGSREGCFLLLCYEPQAALASLPPQTQQNLLSQTMAWVEDLRSQELLRYAEPLEPKAERITVEGHRPENREAALTAIYAIEAKDIKAATAIAHQCPALAYGATVEVQPVWYVDAERT